MKQLDLTSATFWRKTSGKSTLTYYEMRILAEALECKPEYLTGEINDPRPEAMQSKTNEPDQIVYDPEIYAPENTYRDKTGRLWYSPKPSDKDRNPAPDVVQGGVGNAPTKEERGDTLPPDTPVYVPKKWTKVPVLDMGACAGQGWTYDYANVQVETYADLPAFLVGRIDEERPPFVMEIAGDSMTDANLRDGDYGIVNPAEPVYSGDAALCQFGEFRELAFKRIYFLPGGDVELRSANSEEDYPVIRYEKGDKELWENAPLHIIGKVMAFWGKPKRG